MATLAAVLLTIALIVPLRDDRRGRRATLFGAGPLRAVFPVSHLDATELVRVVDAEPRRSAFSALAFRAFGSTFGALRAPGETNAASLAPTAGDDDGTGEPSAGEAENPVPEIAGELDVVDEDRSAFAFDRGVAAGIAADFAADREFALDGDARSFAEELALVDDPASEPPRAAPSTSPGGETPKPPAAVADTSPRATQSLGDDEIVVRSADVGHFERSRPPLTRLPLRPVRADVVWARGLPGGATWSRDERRRFLRACAERPDPSLDAALDAAWREEDSAGRLLALKALAKSPADASRETFLDALQNGNDDERAFAVDVLADREDRDALVIALSDRLDAIAARAALALVGNGSRTDFRAALEPLVDNARLDAILALLTAVFA